MGLNNLTCVGEQWLVWPEICKEEKKKIYIYIYIYIYRKFTRLSSRESDKKYHI